MGLFGITTQTSPSWFNVQNEYWPYPQTILVIFFLLPLKIDMPYVTLKTHHSFHAKQNCTPILSFLPLSVNGTTYHTQQEMPNHSKYSKPNFKLKNTRQRSTTIPEHDSSKYFIADCVSGAAHLTMTFIKKNITHSPLCTCGQAETQANYLLNCPNHISQRHQYFRNLPCPITVNNLLYVGGPITSRYKCPNCHKLT